MLIIIGNNWSNSEMKIFSQAITDRYPILEPNSFPQEITSNI